MKTDPAQTNARTTVPSVRGTWLLTFLLCCLLYSLTAQRTIGWQDSGWYQMRSINGELHTELGLALCHPLYVAAGYALSLLGPRPLPLALNIFSGIGMAIALANLAALLAIITRKRWVGIITAAMLAVCHTVWWLSTVAEVYTWVVAGLTAELWLLFLLLRRPGWRIATALAFVNGLGLCLHNLALLPVPVYLAVGVILVFQRKLPPWSIAPVAVGWLIGSGLYLGMTIDMAVREGSLSNAISSALFARNWSGHVLGTIGESMHLKANLGLAALNFANFLLPLAVVGWIHLGKFLGRLGASAFAAITLIQFLFVARYLVPDQFTFLLPTLVMISFAAGIGIALLSQRGPAWRRLVLVLCCISLAFPPVLYAAAPRIARVLGVQAARARPLPYRDEYCYWLVPWKCAEDSAFRFAMQALEYASRNNGIILPDTTTRSALLFVQRFYGIGSDVIVMHRGCGLPDYRTDVLAFRRAVGDRPLYVHSDSREYLRDRLGALSEETSTEKVHEGILYRLRWKEIDPCD